MNLFKGLSHATALLIANNALQGILSSFFFKYAGQHSATPGEIGHFGRSFVRSALGVTMVTCICKHVDVYCVFVHIGLCVYVFGASL